MSSANETIYIETGEGENEPCWCLECGWDGVENDLAFTNDGIFVCPHCGGEEVDDFYSEDVNSCVFCGSDQVVGTIDIVSLNEMNEASPLDKEQVYGYCARCADVKMAESPEICLACNGVNKDPETHGYCENCRVKCRICGNYLDEDTEGENYENENCGCCYVEAGIIPEWMGHSYYANDYLKDFSPKVLEEYGYDNPCDCGDEDNCEHCSYDEWSAETVYRNYQGRKSPALSATSVKRGTRKRGNDGNMWEVRRSGKSQRWFKGAEEVPVVPVPSSFPQGDGRVLGQQTDQANLSPLHAESFGAENQDMMCCGESMEFYEAVDGSPDYFYCPVCEVSIITKEFDAEDEDNIIVHWPESQKWMEHPEANLIMSDDESSLYSVPKKVIEEHPDGYFGCGFMSENDYFYKKYGGIYEDGRSCPVCALNNMAENACGTPGNDMCNDCCAKSGGCGHCMRSDAEGDDVQMVKIQDPVITGAKMALGVVALNATAIAGAALIGLAIAHTARREV